MARIYRPGTGQPFPEADMTEAPWDDEEGARGHPASDDYDEDVVCGLCNSGVCRCEEGDDVA